MDFCEFPDCKRGTACRRCGYVLRAEYDHPPHRKCPGGPCLHLGEPTGESATVLCRTCNKSVVEKQHPIHACAVLGECLPSYQCTKDALSESMDREIAVCRGCERFAAPAAGK